MKRFSSSLPILSVAVVLVLVQLLCACIGHHDMTTSHESAEHSSAMAESMPVEHAHSASAGECEHCNGQSILHAQLEPASLALLTPSTSEDFVATASTISSFPTPVLRPRYRATAPPRLLAQETLISQRVRLQV